VAAQPFPEDERQGAITHSNLHTMALYFGHASTGAISETVSPALQDQGISMLRAQPHDVNVVVMTLNDQPGYACYLKNLPAYMKATATQRTVAIREGGFLAQDPPELLPMVLPPLSYSFDKALGEAKIAKLKEHSTAIGSGKSLMFVLKDVTVEMIKKLVTEEGASPTARCHYGTVNAESMKMVLMLRRILSLFLYTHAYPAYRHIEDITLEEDTDQEPPDGKKRKITEDDDVGTYEAQEGPSDAEESVDDEGEGKDPYPKAPNYDKVRLVYAKPTRSTTTRWGPLAHIPNSSGLFAPYVKDLAVPDKKTLPGLMERYFAKCFANDLHGIVAKLGQLRSAWGTIHSTSLGNELSHLAKCIDLALQAQAVVYPVYSGTVYEGSVISGAGFTMFGYSEKVYEPISYSKLQDHVVSNSAHSKAVAEIINAVDNEEPFKMDGCSSIRQLSNLLKEEDLDETARAKVVKAAHHLSYPNKYWSTSTHYVHTMLTYILDDKVAIPDDVPMHPNYIFYDSRVKEVMSAFGYEAPSFMIPNGRQIGLDKKDPPENFHVRTLPTATAIGDMMYVLEKGMITNGNKNMSGKHRDLALKSNDKKEVWKTLKGLYERSNKTASTGGQKVEGLPPPAKTDIDGLW